MEEYFLQEESGYVRQNAVRRKVSRQDSIAINDYKLQQDDFKDAKNAFNEQFSKPAKALAVFQRAVRRVIVIYR